MPWHPWNNYNVLRGPFLIYNGTASLIPNTKPLYRCTSLQGKHMFSSTSNCEAVANPDYLIGYLSTVRDSTFPRSLRRCYQSTLKYWYHVTDGACKQGDVDQGVLGYVV